MTAKISMCEIVVRRCLYSAWVLERLSLVDLLILYSQIIHFRRMLSFLSYQLSCLTSQVSNNIDFPHSLYTPA